MRTLRSLVSRFPRIRVVVVGDVMLDRFVWGDVHRINPEAPVPVLRVVRETFAPGGAANAAANLASLGAQVTLAGFAGRDAACDRLARLLRKRGIRALLIPTRRPTITKTRAIARGQQLLRLDYEVDGAPRAALQQQLMDRLTRHLRAADAVLISDYGKGVVTGPLVDHVRSRVPLVTVDPVPAHVAYYHDVTLLTPNTREASELAGMPVRNERELRAVGRALVTRLNASCLITRGERGMTLFRHGVKEFDLPTEAREVIDVTGAGDTVIATTTLAMAAGAAMEQAVVLANRAAGMVVARAGTATVTAEDLRKSLLSPHDS